MKRSRILSSLLLILMGAVGGWLLRPLFAPAEHVPLPLGGGTFECSFFATITIHPLLLEASDDMKLRSMTTEWTFRNNTEEPIRFQLPSQEYHSVGLHGRGFVSLPDAWVMTEAVTIAPSKSITLKNRTGALFTELPKPGSRGFLVSAKLDDEFCILGCEATIKFAPEPETASIDENS